MQDRKRFLNDWRTLIMENEEIAGRRNIGNTTEIKRLNSETNRDYKMSCDLRLYIIFHSYPEV